MDNTAFHRPQKTKELIEFAWYKLVFLFPYFRDLNPIEKFWANMKQWLKNIDKLYDALV